ncbi:hypothetical protein ERJ75_000698600 [Trypanosoma vivax]|nr:hypothetical protein ERJ75_000698600 [Trypanosoma vivax]
MVGGKESAGTDKGTRGQGETDLGKQENARTETRRREVTDVLARKVREKHVVLLTLVEAAAGNGSCVRGCVRLMEEESGQVFFGKCALSPGGEDGKARPTAEETDASRFCFPDWKRPRNEAKWKDRCGYRCRHQGVYLFCVCPKGMDELHKQKKRRKQNVR